MCVCVYVYMRVCACVRMLQGINTVSYRLDETLIEFGMCIENKEFERAVQLLEHLEYSTETEAMWSTLCNLALQGSRLMIAERCCAALGDTARAAYLRKVIDVAETAQAEGLPDGASHFLVRAKMATLDKHFERAEQILLEQGAIDEAMEMYQELHRWDAAIAIAESKNRPETEELKTSYLQWLLETGQEEKAAVLKEKEGDVETAIRLYMQGGLPAKAAALAQNPNYPQTPEMLETIAAALSKSGLHEKAGSFLEKLGMAERGGCSSVCVCVCVYVRVRTSLVFFNSAETANMLQHFAAGARTQRSGMQNADILHRECIACIVIVHSGDRYTVNIQRQWHTAGATGAGRWWT